MADQKHSPESWEQKQAELEKDNADMLAKMTPEQKADFLAKEKIEFQKNQDKLRADLGYKKFDPEEHKKALAGQKESTGFEQSLDKKKEKLPPADLKRFYELFTAATENIDGKKKFDFQSAAIDDLGKPVQHLARMSRLTDHSQKKVLQPAEILDRLQKEEASPFQIGLQIDIDMGEDKNNHLGLTNLSLEVPLVALLEGNFSERISHFTNLVLYAAVMHDKQQKEQAKAAPAVAGVPQQPSKTVEKFEQEEQKFGLSQVGSSGSILPSHGGLEFGDTSTVTFNCNNGSVWGLLDLNAKPASGETLQESVDKISKET
ncbi:hypothetical protein IT411_01825 [Candidatus Peregrinibacteria bacterium]|nr:hypothetical protein [Candidatus Peregrinibacteria bacterium]